MSNISQIAKELGIAASTVSRALKKPDMVSISTRQKVLKKAEQLGYLAKLRNEATSVSNSKLVGVMVADLTNSFSNLLVKAISSYLEERGYYPLIACHYEQASTEANILKQWASLNLKGLIVMPSEKFDKTFSQSDLDIPLVLVDRKSENLGCDSVTEDNIEGMEHSVKYLKELGHQRIAMLMGPKRIYTFNERYLGAIKEEPNVEIVEILAESYEELFIGAFERTNILMLKDEQTRPTALIGANNAITSGILYALNLKGLSVPRDLSLLCYGDSDWCRFYPTPITAMKQPIDEMGNEAAKLLLERIENLRVEAKSICLKSMLLQRASTKGI